MTGAPFTTWLEALEQRHLADLTRAEVIRALRALSSCYVERRSRLSSALDGAGKRAAFALYYAPLHYLVVDRIVRGIPEATKDVREIVDVGCGTGAAGAAWGAACDTAPKLHGVDRHPWAVAEATRTYREFGLRGRATVGDAARAPLGRAWGSAAIIAYTVNELPPPAREALLGRVKDAARTGARVLIVEPVARGAAPWWDAWQHALGAREDEWRFPLELPALPRELARGAGLEPRELIARSLFVSREPV
ncbi:MAG TPA: class I SAM-dependent methyltransferase [Gemmatimonadaceae bacterium]|nr:class I SAM-dependent methyltransferase [Vicinamibacterales bacterium]